MSTNTVCLDCLEPDPDLRASYHVGCCPHERVTTADEADGSTELAHDWRSVCGDCGAEVIPGDEPGEWETI